MQECFEKMNLRWFDRAHFYTGCISDRAKNLDFRYRYEQSKDEKELKASVYSDVAYEIADDIEEQVFPWTEEGVEQMKLWYQEQYEKFLAQHAKSKN